MQSFTTDDYVFRIDGVQHSLPELSIDGFERIAALYEIKNPVQQVAAFRDALIAEAAPETAAAIRKLSPRKAGELFKGWTGIGGDASGEGTGSSD